MPADDMNAATSNPGLRNVPLAALGSRYTTARPGGRGFAAVARGRTWPFCDIRQSVWQVRSRGQSRPAMTAVFRDVAI
jgi:hypothetical protein